MLDHLVHGAVLEESALFVAVLAVVVVDGAIGIGPAIFFAGEGHAAALAELGQLVRGEVLLFLGEGSLVGFEGLRLVIGHEITHGRAVGGLGDAVGLEPSGDELLRQEVGDLGVGRFGVVADAQVAGQAEACVLVEFEVALHAQEADARFARLVSARASLVILSGAKNLFCETRPHWAHGQRNLFFGTGPEKPNSFGHRKPRAPPG